MSERAAEIEGLKMGVLRSCWQIRNRVTFDGYARLTLEDQRSPSIPIKSLEARGIALGDKSLTESE